MSLEEQEIKDTFVYKLIVTILIYWVTSLHADDSLTASWVNQQKTHTLSPRHSIPEYRRPSFHHQLISLDFQEIPIANALKILADFAGVNLVVSGSVHGSVTLHLKDVPWDQALESVLSTQDLDMREKKGVIIIDQADKLSARDNVTNQKLFLIEKARPLQSYLLHLNYAKAVDIAAMLQDKSGALLSERGTISVDTRTNTIWIHDLPTQIHVIRELMIQLDVPVSQVVIEARIVNMAKDCAEDLGIRWGISKPTHLSGTLEGANRQTQSIVLENAPLSERLNLDLGAIPFDASPVSIGIAMAKLGDHVLLDLELSALESEGRAKIVASPRLMTTNQRAAVIESGEDIPYQEATLSGATAVSFKKAVLSLKATPQITPDGKLLMDLLINQDADSGRRVQGVPIVITKSIETSVLVNNGQTIVLGGIYKNNKSLSIVRVPFFGSLPVVGNLFRRKQVRNRNEELLIFITPKIISLKPS
jgi:type IV pilus assembly protein PilQ